MSVYTTGELAGLCGVSIRTVQYYDTRGILSPTELSEGGRRLYNEDALAKMKLICYLRELGLPLDSISELLREKNSREVVRLILEEQHLRLNEELSEKKMQLEKLQELERHLQRGGDISIESIKGVANTMNHEKKLRKIRITMLLTAIPVGLLEIGSILLWIFTGIWWPCVAVYSAVALPFAILLSRYYFKNVNYLCAECHHIFRPRLKEAFFASHTPTTRKLTCPKCGKRGFCIETCREALPLDPKSEG